MDVKKLVYTQEIFIKQRKIEDDLASLNEDKTKNISECNHEEYIPIILTKGAHPSARCLGCGEKFGSFDPMEAIDASNYKDDVYKEGFTERQKTDRLQDLRAYAIRWLKNNPTMQKEDLKKELLNEINMQKIKK